MAVTPLSTRDPKPAPPPTKAISEGSAYFNGAIVPFASANVSIGTHALNYGTACFEGIRAYWNPEQQQLYLFKLPEHYRRLLRSANLLKMHLHEDVETLCAVTREMLRRDGYRVDVYVRPLAYKATPMIKVDLHSPQDAIAIFSVPMGDYAKTDGLRVTISSWRRISDNSIPARAKISGAYINTALAIEDAQAAGFDECLMLSEDGHVAEGSSSNFFMVWEGALVTSPVSDDILVGITRESVMQLARDRGLPVVERRIDRTEVYQAEEAFLCGTGVQIAPIFEVDGRAIGGRTMGPITSDLQQAYFRAVRGDDPAYRHWCTPVSG